GSPVDEARGLNRQRHSADIEAGLEPVELAPGARQALRQAGQASDEQSLQLAQFRHGHQDERKIDRHAAGDSGQLDFQSRRQAGHQQESDESDRVDCVRAGYGCPQDAEAQDNHQHNENPYLYGDVHLNSSRSLLPSFSSSSAIGSASMSEFRVYLS